ncbi:DEAD/DEAH box helicase [Runella sp. MFBS21]|uniref:DEAD/DEAH box helicase n=1 Tax=Runella sp. MFBS21 TaxID=3034018 RepID=UPI0023F7A4BE|nr:DEAD/DEAH box helicase [Runella sp. MFBS21]MDF7822172.1 DEAD/DEAH box helicase [Runella sp. MFBS21]
MQKKYTANYAFTNPNFVIQNLVDNQIKSEYLSVYFVVKNLLQRGFPTILSKYLQDEIGEIHKQNDFNKENLFVLIDTETPIWHNTIKGDTANNYFPAKTFFEQIIPQHFGEYAFVQFLIFPEVEINELTGEYNKDFISQQVDFFLPQVKLVIEIDGQHHKDSDVTRVKDSIRDNYLTSKGIKTVRITTNELRNGTFKAKINEIIKHLAENEKKLLFYKNAYAKIKNNDISDYEYRAKFLPTAIIRFQLLVLDLLINDYISINDKAWKFNILERDIKGFAELAIQDLFLWLENLCQLGKLNFQKPKTEIKTYQNENRVVFHKDFIPIDFSLFKRYTDENELYPDKIYVRTDYFGAEKNYFRASTTEPLKYEIVSDNEQDKSALRFFLQNIFEKPDFREGQFPIIVNALQRNDTIGLLPTGGGKSICYQLPCLLQPSINFVVCPIKSLMYDQQDNLNNSLVTNTNFISGDLTSAEKEKIQFDFSQGKYLFIWVSPERFQIKTFREYLASVNANFSIAYAVIDEVHCLSEWGHDFRTSYLNLANTIEKYCPDTKFIGLTATASVNVLKDVKIEFKLKDENVKTLLDYSRKELHFEVINDKGQKWEILKQKLDELNRKDDFLDHSNNAGLAFTPNVNGEFGCYTVSNKLNTIYRHKVKWYSGDTPSFSTKILVDNIVAGNAEKVRERVQKHLESEGFEKHLIDKCLNDKLYEVKGTKNPKWFQILIGQDLPVMNEDDFKRYKKDVQKSFKKNDFPLMIATKAFGMGIDKQNIHYTFHYGLPSSVEALYQEAGRAGRWDKNDPKNKSKKAKCFVFHSHETFDKQLVDEIFAPETSITRIAEINKKVGFGGKDIFRIIFLFMQGQRDIQEDFIIVKFLIDTYFQAKTTKKIFWDNAKNDLRTYSQRNFKKTIYANENEIQKGIYRLSLLGVVKDWTTDFVTHYEVEFNQFTEKNALESLARYIHKYEPLTDVETKVKAVNKTTTTDKSIWYLLQWTWDNIVYTRRQSIKTLSDWCSEFDNSEAFKARIDTYFKFTETTFIIQHIAENPKEFEKWFEIFYVDKVLQELDENGKNKKERIYLPETLDLYARNQEFSILKDSLSRFLESYRSNIGLNLISGFIRLFLDGYEDTDGKPRLENAISQSKDLLSAKEQDIIIEKMISLGLYLSEENKYKLAKSIIKFYPEKLEFLAEKFNIIYLLGDVLTDKLKSLKATNQRFYEQLAKI